jgi:hypothetical protein
MMIRRMLDSWQGELELTLKNIILFATKRYIFNFNKWSLKFFSYPAIYFSFIYLLR